MIFIFDTDLNKLKPINYSLLKIYGINRYLSSIICKRAGFSSNLKVQELNSDQIKILIKVVEKLNLKINIVLHDYKRLLFAKLVTIKAYRGLRKLAKLPIRGQRTHTNAKTCKKVL